MEEVPENNFFLKQLISYFCICRCQTKVSFFNTATEPVKIPICFKCVFYEFSLS